MKKSKKKKTGRGLASSSKEVRQKVAALGGNAPHKKRGLEAADEETRKRVAAAGGKASRGGGRKKAEEDNET